LPFSLFNGSQDFLDGLFGHYLFEKFVEIVERILQTWINQALLHFYLTEAEVNIGE